jgi:hypothetical protein
LPSISSGVSDRPAAAEKQLRWHSQLLHELAVESVHSPRNERWVRAFLAENELPADVDLTISPDDRMFQYLLYTMAGHRNAIAEYFASAGGILPRKKSTRPRRGRRHRLREALTRVHILL